MFELPRTRRWRVVLDLLASYVVHTVSAAVWTGGVAFAGYGVFPPAMAGRMEDEPFERNVNGLLQLTRWTGITLPVTGPYQTWQLYPLDTVLTTPAGWLVLATFGSWGVMHGLLELGVSRMRTADGESLGIGRDVTEGYVADGGCDVARRARVGWPYLVASGGCAVLLLVDAGLLASGLV